MADMKDLLGAILGRGMTESSARRVESSLSEDGIGGAGGILEQLGLVPAKVAVGAPSRAEEASGIPGDVLGKLGSVAKSIFGEGEQGTSLAAGGPCGARGVSGSGVALDDPPPPHAARAAELASAAAIRRRVNRSAPARRSCNLSIYAASKLYAILHFSQVYDPATMT